MSFAGSALLVRSLPDEHAVAPPTSRIRDDIVEGLRFMWRNVAIRRITVILAAINFFYFAATSLLVLYNSQQLHGSDTTYTAMFLGAATGTVITRFFVSRVTERCRHRAHHGDGRVAVGVVDRRAGAHRPCPGWPSAMYFLLGTGTGLWWAVNTTARQRITPPRLARPSERRVPHRQLGRGAVRCGASAASPRAGGVCAPRSSSVAW